MDKIIPKKLQEWHMQNCLDIPNHSRGSIMNKVTPHWVKPLLITEQGAHTSTQNGNIKHPHSKRI